MPTAVLYSFYLYGSDINVDRGASWQLAAVHIGRLASRIGFGSGSCLASNVSHGYWAVGVAIDQDQQLPDTTSASKLTPIATRVTLAPQLFRHHFRIET